MRSMVGVAQSAERGLVEPDVASSSLVVYPDLPQLWLHVDGLGIVGVLWGDMRRVPPSLGGGVVSKTSLPGSTPGGGANT